MKKLVFLALLLTMVFAACAPSASLQASGAQATQAPSANQKVEVIWYVRSNEGEQKWETETVIPDFTKKNPNITINLVVVPWADFDTKMQTMIAAGTPPDIWSHWGPSGFQDYVKRGLVADLTPFIEKNKFDLSDFEPSVLDIYKVDGKLMGIPMLTTGSFLFYNKDLFDKAGVKYPTTNWDDKSWTWDKFLEMCKALTNVKGDPSKDVYGCNLGFWPNDAYSWMWGVDLFPDSAYKTGFADESNMGNSKVIDAFQAKQDLVWKYHYMPDPATTDAMSAGGGLFEGQKVAVNLTGGWGWWNYTSAAKDFKWAAAALPYGSDGRRDPIFTDPWLMSSKTAHPNEAWSFLAYLASSEVQESWMKLTNAPPVRKSLAEKWYQQFPTMKPEDVKQVHLGALKYGRESPNHLLVKYDQLNQIINAAVDPVTNNAKKAAETIPDAKKKLDEALKQIKAEFK